MEKTRTVAEEVTGAVQGEMPMTWTRVVAVDIERSSRALGSGRRNNTFHW